MKISMAYHKFSNLREMFQGDLNTKVMRGIKSLDYEDLDCSCKELLDEACDKQSEISDCRTGCIVYEAECKICNMVYIGNSQNKNKKRQNQHFGDVKRPVARKVKNQTHLQNILLITLRKKVSAR